MNRFLALLFLAHVCISVSVAAQPDRSLQLEKAKAKFEKDIAKADETLLASMDKSLAQATKTGNKMLQEKLTYERSLFATQHIIPTVLPAEGYLRERTKATNALSGVFQPIIGELTKAKKFEEAMAVEDLLSDVLKAGRGFGLAIPDIEAHQELIFQIEHKASGLVLDTEADNGRGKLVLNPKNARTRPCQFWRLERDEKGFLIRNVKAKQYVHVGNFAGESGPMLATGSFDQKKETPPSYLFQLTSIRHELVIEQPAGESVLIPLEKKAKGVTVTYVSLDKKETQPSAVQIWKLIEVK